jgi:hypothetical protein
MEDEAIMSRANELYWGSDLSVNQIAETLELSKSRLYGVIRPEPTGRACPICGFEADFPNRTAKDRKMVVCSECGFEGVELELRALDDVSLRKPSARERLQAHVPDGGRSVFWGTVLLGTAAGFYLFSRRNRS